MLSKEIAKKAKQVSEAENRIKTLNKVIQKKHQKRHSFECLLCFGAICYANNLALLCAQIISSNLLVRLLHKQCI